MALALSQWELTSPGRGLLAVLVGALLLWAMELCWTQSAGSFCFTCWFPRFREVLKLSLSLSSTLYHMGSGEGSQMQEPLALWK